MTTPDPDATRQAADRLSISMQGLREEIVGLRSYGERNRRLIWGLLVSLALDLILSIVVAVVAVQAAETSSAASQNRQMQISSCEAGNQARMVSTQLWNYVLDLSERNIQTPEQRQRIAEFRQYMTTSLAPRDCSVVGGR